MEKVDLYRGVESLSAGAIVSTSTGSKVYQKGRPPILSDGLLSSVDAPENTGPYSLNGGVFGMSNWLAKDLSDWLGRKARFTSGIRVSWNHARCRCRDCELVLNPIILFGR